LSPVRDKRLDAKVIFVHLPKSGGTTFRQALQVYRWFWHNGHHTAKSAKALYPAEMWDRCYRVGMIRNPYERMVSGYYHHYGAASKSHPNHIEGFEKWVLKYKGKGFAAHWLDASLMYLIDGELAVHDLFKNEEMQKGIDKVCAYVDAPKVTLRSANVNQRRLKANIPTAEFYRNAAVVAQVQDWCAWEFEAGGYDA